MISIRIIRIVDYVVIGISGNPPSLSREAPNSLMQLAGCLIFL